MFRSSTSSFDRLLEKATSQLLLEADWQSTLALTDLIRGGEVPPKYAVSAIKKKFYSENPHVSLYALGVMECCVKNCGSLVHEEVATKAFMEELRDIVKRSNDQQVKEKVLEMIQNWGMAFRNSQKYRIVTDTLNLMKAEGWEFPPIREAEAMFEADVAPEWKEGEVCHRCRTQFGIMTRQHHCRACGQVFCAKCSSRSCLLPKFGIEKEVRVCDSCYEEYGPKDSAPSSSHSSPAKKKQPSSSPHHHHHPNMDSDLPAEYLSSSLAQQAPPPRSGKTEEEIKEEEELQLALALSQSEAEEQEKAKKKAAQQYRQHQERLQVKEEKAPASKDEEISPELMRYLDRNYWDKKEQDKEARQREQKSSVSMRASAGGAAAAGGMSAVEKYQAAGAAAMATGGPVAAAAAGGAVANRQEDEDLDEFVTTLKTQVEIFVNRMKSNSSRGRSISNDSSVQTLFMNTMAMHSQLLRHIQAQEDKRVHYEGLQDKITQVKDARAALEALREEEREKKRREAEEAERLRQQQMQEKLEVMRKKKQEYLQYQRQMALQRMQEQERELMLRQEQVKQQYMMQQQNPQMQMPGMPPVSAASGMYPGMQQGYAPPPGAPGYGPAPPVQGGLPQQQPMAYADPNLNPGVALPQQQPYQAATVMSPPGQQQPPPPQQQQPQMVPQTMAAPAPGIETVPTTSADMMAQQQPLQQQQQQPQPYNMQGMAGALPQVMPGGQFHPVESEGELITFE